MGYWQCLPLSVVQLKGKHCRKPHCPNGVADTFGLWYPQFFQKMNEKIQLNYYDISGRIVFVRFLEELKTPKRHFKIK